jgi:hypothetical protein
VPLVPLAPAKIVLDKVGLSPLLSSQSRDGDLTRFGSIGYGYYKILKNGETMNSCQTENSIQSVTSNETTQPVKCTILAMLSAEEITDVRFFGHGRHPKKLVAVSRANWRISIGKVRHGSYFLPKGIVLDNGDHISTKRIRYNYRTRKTEPVALFAWSERWQYEYEKQCECEKLGKWLEADSRADDVFFVLEYVATLGGLPEVPKHLGIASYAKAVIRQSLYRLNLVDLRWLTDELLSAEKSKAA